MYPHLCLRASILTAASPRERKFNTAVMHLILSEDNFKEPILGCVRHASARSFLRIMRHRSDVQASVKPWENVHTLLDTARGEPMPKAVMGDEFHLGRFRSDVY